MLSKQNIKLTNTNELFYVNFIYKDPTDKEVHNIVPKDVTVFLKYILLCSCLTQKKNTDDSI